MADAMVDEFRQYYCTPSSLVAHVVGVLLSVFLVLIRKGKDLSGIPVHVSYRYTKTVLA